MENKEVEYNEVLYYTYTENGQLFWSNVNNEVYYIHENDSEFRSEYHGKMLSTVLGIKTEFKPDWSDVPSYVKLELNEYE